MEKSRFLFHYFIILTAAVAPVVSVDLNCTMSRTTVIVTDELLIEFPGGHRKYPNDAHCNWSFKSPPGSSLSLKFHHFEVEYKCRDYLTVNFLPRICSLPDVNKPFLVDDELDLHFSSDSSAAFTGFRATIRRIDPLCDLGRFKPSEALTLFRISNPTAGDKDRGQDYTEREHEYISSTQLIWPGSDKGMEICWGEHAIYPASDVPSCNAAFPDDCKWETTADVIMPENSTSRFHYPYPDKVFSAAGKNFRTVSSSLQMEKVCISVKYLSESDDGLLMLHAEAPQGREQLAAKNLHQGSWNTEVIVAEVPVSYWGKLMRLSIDVFGSNRIYVKMLQGCDPYQKEDRYTLKLDDKKIRAVTNVNDNIWAGSVGYKCKNRGRRIGTDPEKCTCRAGFIGDDCGIGCGPNRIGPDCQLECSPYLEGCKRTIICKKWTGCKCAPGWKGANCEHECNKGEYGVGCEEDCGHCLNEEPCDIYTGQCKEGCAQGFHPPLCQSRLPHLMKAPIVISERFTSARLKVNFTSREVKGVGDPKFYKFQYKKFESEQNEDERDPHWKDTEIRPIPSDMLIEETVGDLHFGRSYEARIILIDEWLDSYEGEDLPKARIDTNCTVNLLNITRLTIGDDVIYLNWKDDSEDELRCPYKRYNVSIREDNDWRSVVVDKPAVKFEFLLPNRTYHFKLKSIGKHSPRYFYASYTTLPSMTGAIGDLQVVDTDRNSVKLKWKVNTWMEDTCSVTYKCVRVLLDPLLNCTAETGSYNSTDKQITVGGLRPFTKYSFRVKLWFGTDDSQVSAVTALFVDNPGINVEKTFATNTTIDVAWKMDCQLCHLYTGGYYVKLEKNMDGLEPNEADWAFTEDEKFTFVNLQPGTPYKLLVCVSNKTKTIISQPFNITVTTKSNEELDRKLLS